MRHAPRAVRPLQLPLTTQTHTLARCSTRLEPYGGFGGETGSGRKWVGRYRTDLTPAFWTALAVGLGCDLRLVKVRGGNAHHQLESAFKAFARAFRAALDNLADGGARGYLARVRVRVSPNPIPSPKPSPSPNPSPKPKPKPTATAN